MENSSLSQRIYKIVDESKVYSIIYTVTVLMSIVPLMFKNTNCIFLTMEFIAVTFFIADYILRFICSKEIVKKGKKSFLIYPFKINSIIDFISIIPFFIHMFEFLVPIKIIRLLKLIRVFRILRYNKQIITLRRAIKRESKILNAMLVFVSLYIFIISLIVFQIEPDTFENFFDAIYWATVSLTTVGYGDLYAVTTLGRVVSIISSIIGVGIIALPSGIIAASFVEIYRENKEGKEEIK